MIKLEDLVPKFRYDSPLKHTNLYEWYRPLFNDVLRICGPTATDEEIKAQFLEYVEQLNRPDPPITEEEYYY